MQTDMRDPPLDRFLSSTWRFFRRFWWLILMALMFNQCSYYSLPSYGKVVDLETGEPIEGVVVEKEWRADRFAVVESFSGCYHEEVVRTKQNGNYYLPSWYRYTGPMVFEKHSSVDLYKAGYTDPSPEDWAAFKRKNKHYWMDWFLWPRRLYMTKKPMSQKEFAEDVRRTDEWFKEIRESKCQDLHARTSK